MYKTRVESFWARERLSASPCCTEYSKVYWLVNRLHRKTQSEYSNVKQCPTVFLNVASTIWCSGCAPALAWSIFDFQCIIISIRPPGYLRHRFEMKPGLIRNHFVQIPSSASKKSSTFSSGNTKNESLSIFTSCTQTTNPVGTSYLTSLS